jgi:hypothetical protein
MISQILLYFQALLLNIASQTKKPGSESKELDSNSSSKDVYSWLLDKMKDSKSLDVAVHKSRGFDPGKIYIFKYDPLYKDSYSYWDEHPIILSLGKMPAKVGYMHVGINLSWYPPKARRYIISTIMKVNKKFIEDQIKKYPGDAKKQRGIYIDLAAMKSALDQSGFSFAIRNYLPSQIQTSSYCISYEHWEKMTKLDVPREFPQLKGTVGIFQIYKNFEIYVKKYNMNKVANVKKTEENRKLMKYKFIK